MFAFMDGADFVIRIIAETTKTGEYGTKTGLILLTRDTIKL